ncbi:hypothetical protein [Glycomyces harbinensis]|uniref:Uncharacterized protein n=1 Tax=Glycomyces harbinensis TaxID=58114 RepID=A0A1G7AST6_9ACTN|nr:hypothetical protein [Glycomyces harbinensis]SDE17851.1 hypothetical protein SAMN05216270_114130 [Glycomyces harbinensis]
MTIRPHWPLVYLAGTVIAVGAAVLVSVAPIDSRLFTDGVDAIPGPAADSAEAAELEPGLNMLPPEGFIPLDRWDGFDGSMPGAESVSLGDHGFNTVLEDGFDGPARVVRAAAEFVNANPDHFALVTAEARVDGPSGVEPAMLTRGAFVSPGSSAFAQWWLADACDGCETDPGVEFVVTEVRWYTPESDHRRAAYAEGGDPGLTEIEVIAIDRRPGVDLEDITAMIRFDSPADFAIDAVLIAVLRDADGAVVGAEDFVTLETEVLPPGESDRTAVMLGRNIPAEADLSKTEFHLQLAEVVWEE